MLQKNKIKPMPDLQKLMQLRREFQKRSHARTREEMFGFDEGIQMLCIAMGQHVLANAYQEKCEE